MTARLRLNPLRPILEARRDSADPVGTSGIGAVATVGAGTQTIAQCRALSAICLSEIRPIEFRAANERRL